jgi:hypothetical protein
LRDYSETVFEQLDKRVEQSSALGGLPKKYQVTAVLSIVTFGSLLVYFALKLTGPTTPDWENCTLLARTGTLQLFSRSSTVHPVLLNNKMPCEAGYHY